MRKLVEFIDCCNLLSLMHAGCNNYEVHDLCAQSVRCGTFSSVAIIPLRAKACNILIVKYRSLLTII